MILDEFLVRALLGGIGVAIVAGPLGSFLVWRRMAFFGDTLAHSALLGIALGLMLGTGLTIGVVVLAVAVAGLLVFAQGRDGFAADTLLGILSHGALSLGLVVLAFMDGVRIDLMAYLFGDILAIGQVDLYWIFGGGAVALAGLAVIWRHLLAVTVHEDLARVEGVPVRAVQFIFMILIALLVALSIPIVGVLLVTALMIIPAAAARSFSRTPGQMAFGAAVVGTLAVCGGLWGSLAWDTPSGPSIVVAGLTLFVLTQLVSSIVRRK